MSMVTRSPAPARSPAAGQTGSQSSSSAWLTSAPLTLSNFLIIASKTSLYHKLLIEPRDTAAEGGLGRGMEST